MEWQCLPDRSGIDSIVEEDDQCCSPISSDWPGFVPTARALHLMSREVEGVQLGLGQIVLSSNVSLWLVSGKSWKRFDEVMFPGPRQSGSKM